MQHMSGRGKTSTGETVPASLFVADDAIVSVMHFSVRTDDLSNGLIWPKDG
ncbi:hypothetical protein [Mesorhizobium sp. CA16]|uniref:hypothetical protein n=1 Tax=Mesorhizobium sp. CA16 TaxID=588496 RepID=UPI001CC9F094|nr:hypothetical protein [Mesorhizobium sp. CA16]MBZ9912591.1 hypothetical protein [Mesorhizobium sp. CA16]